MKTIAATLLLVLVAQTPDAFEVASIKPAGPAAAANLARFGGGCDGGLPRVDHSRFTVTTTLYALTTWAYAFNKNGGCSFVSYGNLISGGPEWITSDRFTIQALMPDGVPDYTTAQFLNGDAPQLELMIKNLLSDRFQLAVHRETRQVRGYELVVGKDGPRVSATTEGKVSGLGGARLDRKPDGTLSQYYGARRTTMAYIALHLGLVTRSPVVDRTGLTGEFTFDLEFAPVEAGLGESSAPSVFTALQEQLGLKLESARVPAQVIVIDRAERPSAD